MKKVIIKNLSGTETHSATKEDPTAWISECVENNIWGKKAGEYAISQLSESELLTEISRRDVSDLGGNLIEPLVTIPAQYTIEITDITAEIETQQKQAEGINRQQLGATIIAKVYAINESKNISAETFTAMLADATLERIERLLWTGSIKTAKLLIQSLDTTYFNLFTGTLLNALI